MVELCTQFVNQRFQPSETEKREVVQVLVILVLKKGPKLFVSKFVMFSFSSTRRIFDYIAIMFGRL